jgi:hypothetical protein
VASAQSLATKSATALMIKVPNMMAMATWSIGGAMKIVLNLKTF